MLLSSLIKDADDVCDRSPEQLGCPLLKVINSLASNDQHRRNFLLSDATVGYPPQYKQKLEEAITEAWHWLTTRGYLVPRTNSMDSEFVQISLSGMEFMRTCDAPNMEKVPQSSSSEFTPSEEAPPSDIAVSPEAAGSAAPSQNVDPGLTRGEKESGKRDSIDANSVSDEATTRDSLDFGPYVDALSRFLLHKKTQPPLTLAIEGEWGSGKSSFMLQLQEQLEKKSPKDRIVRFNPWRYEKQDELWAAFALELTRTLRERAPFARRIWGDLALFRKRIKGFSGWANLVVFALLWVVALCGAVGILHWAATKTPAEQQAIVTHLASSSSEEGAKEGEKEGAKPSANPGSKSEAGGKPAKEANSSATGSTESDKKDGKINPLYQGLLGWGTRSGAVAILLAIITMVWKSIRSRLLDVRLERFIEKPDYKGHASFVEDFRGDFAKAVSAYTVSSESKVFVFIDDLDRCEVPKAAELIQAINLLIGDGKQLIYILAIDRQKVAAGIAQKFKELLEFLPEYEDKNGITVRSKLAFGYSFLEKFIQLSVRVPLQDDPKKVEQFLNDLVSPPVTEAPKRKTYIERQISRLQSLVGNNAVEVVDSPPVTEPVDTNRSTTAPKEPEVPTFDPNRVEFNGESERARAVVLMVRHVFRNNPRRLKIFLNSFRLAVYLASSQGLLDIDRQSRRQVATLEQLGKFIALTMRFPELLDVLANNVTALAEYEKAFLASPGWPGGIPEWLNKDGVAGLFRYMGESQQETTASVPEYSFEAFPVGKMLSAVPLAPLATPVSSLPQALRPLAETFIASLERKTPRRNVLLQELVAEAKRINYVSQIEARAASGEELDLFMALGVAAEPDLIQDADDDQIDEWFRLAIAQIKDGGSPHADYIEYRALWALRDMEKARRLGQRREELLSILNQNVPRLTGHLNRRTMVNEILQLMDAGVEQERPDGSRGRSDAKPPAS